MPFNISDLEKSNKKPDNKREVTDEEMKNLMITAIRMGNWLTYQASNQDQIQHMAQSLWARNFPNQEVPDDLDNRLEELRDEKTGDSFFELITDSVRKDWAMDENTHYTMIVLEQMASNLNAPSFVMSVQETVKDLAEPFQEGARSFIASHRLMN
jgi:hypothetical protein